MSNHAPVLILQHLHADGPAYLGSWLVEQGIAYEVFNAEAGQVFPSRIDGYRALAVLGGEMSANDPLPSLRRAEALIREAMARGTPVLGLCLGAQLMARSLGASVSASPAPEVGWHAVTVSDDEHARHWFREVRSPTVFQWHYEAFALPSGAKRLASSAACANQAFAVGPHLGLQFHVEVDMPKLLAWTHANDARYEAAHRGHASVHAPQRMREDALKVLVTQQRMARHIYRRWLQLD